MQFMKILLVFCFLLLVKACTGPGTLPAGAALAELPPLSARDQLQSSLREAGKEYVIISHKSGDWIKKFKENPSGGGFRRGIQTEYVPDTAAEEYLSKYPCLIVGTPETNTAFSKILPGMPFRFEKGGVALQNELFTHPSTLLSIAFYPSPLNKKLPVSVLTGLDEKAVFDFYEKTLGQRRGQNWRQWGYAVIENGGYRLMGQFDADNNWALGGDIHYTFNPNADTLELAPPYRYLAATTVDPAIADTTIARHQRAIARALAFVGEAPPPAAPFNYYFYASAEEKGLHLQNTDCSHVDFERMSACSVLEGPFEGNEPGKPVELFLRSVLGAPRTKALESGLALYFTRNWQFEGYNYWAKKLHDTHNLDPLSRLLDSKTSADMSPILYGCMAASLVEFLIHTWGKEKFLSQYLAWAPASQADIQALESSWKVYLSAQQAVPPSRKISSTIQAGSFYKGFNFAHEGYGIHNGYLSQSAFRAIKHLKSMQANSIAVVPYTNLRTPNEPAPFPLANFAGGENDESVIQSSFYAQSIGMKTMLKPQIWVGRGWPGDINMKSDEDWKKFFAYYYDWIRHYALIAEINHFDLFCVGVEMTHTTLQREQDWRALIQKIRGIYSGPITYAANWGAEFEELKFWDALDYIGIDCYYPLSNDKQATKKELAKGFDKIVANIEQVVKKNQKPLLFTEIGFRSITSPWVQPHANNEGSPYSGEDQALCYRIVLEKLTSQPWCNGLFWWKFPSYLEYRGPGNDDYHPYNKPAEEVVKEWFGKERVDR